MEFRKHTDEIHLPDTAEQRAATLGILFRFSVLGVWETMPYRLGFPIPARLCEKAIQGH